jgi:hypothetical protein
MWLRSAEMARDNRDLTAPREQPNGLRDLPFAQIFVVAG